MKVVVLMSTWNGERFVAEQLRSILDQLPDGGRVIVRDDGSSDQTVACISELNDPRITIIQGWNLGFAGSFFSLLDAAPADADIIMLSDQDDVWLPNKIAKACSHLRSLVGVPALYCSRLALVDSELRPLGLSPKSPRGPSFQNALAENIVTGCTCAMNRAALELARQHGNLDLVYFHDWWMYLVVSAFGRVVVDNDPTILYRQHSGNVIGMGSGSWRIFSILRFIGRKNWVHIMFDQIENFRATHGAQLSAENRALLDRYFAPRNPFAVLRLLSSPRRFRQTLDFDVLLRLLILASWATRRGLASR